MLFISLCQCLQVFLSKSLQINFFAFLFYFAIHVVLLRIIIEATCKWVYSSFSLTYWGLKCLLLLLQISEREEVHLMDVEERHVSSKRGECVTARGCSGGIQTEPPISLFSTSKSEFGDTNKTV